MQNVYKKIILAISEAIDYKDDREELVKQFFQNIDAQTLIGLLNLLTSEKREQVRKQLIVNANSQEKIDEIFKKEFTEAQVQKVFNKAVENTIRGWMITIAPALSEDQKSKLVKLAKDYKLGLSV